MRVEETPPIAQLVRLSVYQKKKNMFLLRARIGVNLRLKSYYILYSGLAATKCRSYVCLPHAQGRKRQQYVSQRNQPPRVLVPSPPPNPANDSQGGVDRPEPAPLAYQHAVFPIGGRSVCFSLFLSFSRSLGGKLMTGGVGAWMAWIAWEQGGCRRRQGGCRDGYVPEFGEPGVLLLVCLKGGGGGSDMTLRGGIGHGAVLIVLALEVIGLDGFNGMCR